MIAKISGVVDEVSENRVVVNCSGICYELFLPTAVMKNLDGQLQKNSEVSFRTYHYYQTDPSKSIPILIGFGNNLEKEFFEKFITVSGVGPKAAVRALSMPIPDIAEAIDGGDLDFLKSLPGIGTQRAKEIIAKLQGKMSRFGLMRSDKDRPSKTPSDQSGALKEEALDVLLQLQYKKEEAQQMIQKAFFRKPDLAAVEDILTEVYRQKKERS